MFRPTRGDIDPVTREPTAYALWDRYEWQQLGECWLWCGRDNVDVTWIGPVQSSGMHAAVYACRACLYELDQRVLRANMRKDASVLPASRMPERLASVAEPSHHRHPQVVPHLGRGGGPLLPAGTLAGEPKRKEREMAESTTLPQAQSGLLVAVEELSAVHDRYDSLRSDNQGSSGDAPWPGGDGNLHDSE